MKRIYSSLFLLLSTLAVSAQFGNDLSTPGGFNQGQGGKNEKATWSVAYETRAHKELHVGDTITVVLSGIIEQDWYIYSNDFDPALGPNVAEINFEPNGKLQAIGKTKPVGAKSHYEKIWEGTVSTFEQKAKFTQQFVIKADVATLKGSVTYQACSIVNGSCLPPKTHDFELVIRAKAKAGSEQTVDATPAPSVPAITNTPKATSSTVETLEKEKENYRPRSTAGSDISRDYLNNFVRRYGK